MDILTKWKEAQAWERNWWMNGEKHHQKEIYKGDVVAGWLGITAAHMPGVRQVNSVIDIGCGPFSLLQRYRVNHAVAVDPIHYGHLEKVYEELGIRREYIKGEDIQYEGHFDEAWIYNCLQHVVDPVTILHKAKENARKVRLFEWVDVPTDTGHLHTLTAAQLTEPFSDWDCVVRLDGLATKYPLRGKFLAAVFQHPGQD